MLSISNIFSWKKKSFSIYFNPTLPIGSKDINEIIVVIKIRKNLNFILDLILKKIKNISKKNNKFVGFKKGAKNFDK